MFKYEIVVEVSEDASFKSIEELAEAIKMWRGVRNVMLKNASQQTLALDAAKSCANCNHASICVQDEPGCHLWSPRK